MNSPTANWIELNAALLLFAQQQAERLVLGPGGDAEWLRRVNQEALGGMLDVLRDHLDDDKEAMLEWLNARLAAFPGRPDSFDSPDDDDVSSSGLGEGPQHRPHRAAPKLENSIHRLVRQMEEDIFGVVRRHRGVEDADPAEIAGILDHFRSEIDALLVLPRQPVQVHTQE